ncbi:hypothetical protein [Salipiger abyssi]|uniref:hypothetical protein n=1 Tax=Salipiger abyssi TaxID=1250539 RepID=UPI001A8D2208|nr:hypothetical protein [Salipiger abyssi]MBN9889898.1 hypothetical protein [Salipiger abyssi]
MHTRGMVREVTDPTLGPLMHPGVVPRIDLLSLIKALVVEGTACSILSLGAVWEEIGNGSIVAAEVRGINLSRTIYSARSPHKTITGLLVKTEDVLISSIIKRLTAIAAVATLG